MNTLLYIAAFFVSMVFIFLKGLQQQNAVGGYYKAAFATSMLLTLFEVTVVSLIVTEGWSIAIPMSIGSSIGIISSMYLYRRFDKHNRSNSNE